MNELSIAAIKQGLDPSVYNQAAQAQASKQQQQMKQAGDLKQLITGKNMDVQGKLTEDTAKRAAEGKQLMDMFGGKTPQEAIANATANGQSVKMGDTMVGADPSLRFAQNNMKGNAAAIGAVQKAYDTGLAPIQKKANAAAEGLEVINDPGNIGSLGQARTLVLSSMGMNRFNEHEAGQSVPGTLVGGLSQLFNQAGDDSNPLQPNQKQMLGGFFQHQLDMSKRQHDALKQTSLQKHQLSPYYDPVKQQQLEGSLGKPMDQFFQDTAQKYKQVPQTGGYQPPPPGQAPQQQPSPGIMGSLKDLLLGKQQPAPAVPQQQGGPDPLDAKRARLQQLQMKAQQGPAAPQQAQSPMLPIPGQ